MSVKNREKTNSLPTDYSVKTTLAWNFDYASPLGELFVRVELVKETALI